MRICYSSACLRPGGEVANASVCKTDIRGFDSRPGLTYAKGSIKEPFAYVSPGAKQLLALRAGIESRSDIYERGGVASATERSDL